MGYKDIDLEEWFDTELFEGDDFDDEEEENEDLKTCQTIKKRAKNLLTKLQKEAPPAKQLKSNLYAFYKESIEEAESIEFRQVLNDFIIKVIEESKEPLDPKETIEDFIFGHVDMTFRPESILTSKIPAVELKSVLESITQSLVKDSEVLIPGITKLKLRKGGGNVVITSSKPSPEGFDKNASPETFASKESALAPFASAIHQVLVQDPSPFEINGFGVFQLQELPAYDGRNPITKEVVKVPAKFIVIFRPKAEYKKKLA